MNAPRDDRYWVVPLMYCFFLFVAFIPIFSSSVCIDEGTSKESLGLCFRQWLPGIGPVILSIAAIYITHYWAGRQYETSKLNARIQFLRDIEAEENTLRDAKKLIDSMNLYCDLWDMVDTLRDRYVESALVLESDTRELARRISNSREFQVSEQLKQTRRRMNARLTVISFHIQERKLDAKYNENIDMNALNQDFMKILRKEISEIYSGIKEYTDLLRNERRKILSILENEPL
jgi:hypothetical protein